MIDSEQLLRRHRPVLKYDSHEPYFADSAAEWTDNPGNRLTAADGTVIAAASPGDDEQRLELAFLAAERYANDREVDGTDVISDPSREYREQARRLHQVRKYRNRVYGRAKTDSEGQTWLQYWFFYFYNDYNLIGHFLHAGRHEGDWEMIQVLLDGSQAPACAVYAQHTEAHSRRWDQVDRVPGTQRPIVYVARGSHASYFEPGTHWTGHWFDHADGKRRSPALHVAIVRENEPEWRWILWPGYWGDTKKTGNPLDTGSPRGPSRHSQWNDPLALLGAAKLKAATPLPAPPLLPPPPRVVAVRVGHRIRLDYEVTPSPSGTQPIGLVVTINSPDESSPPTSYTLDIEEPTGELDVPGSIEDAKRYDVYVSAATADGLASESVRCDIAPLAP